ncbi:MAG: hypothetical protein JW770_01380 [Actinobacteria bacterium]|nr:hypothetical protein [Actinomycetota bacterium]
MAKTIRDRFRDFYLSWYPQEIRYDVDQRNRANRIILLGLLLRLAFMPFTAHNDFLSEHIRVFQIADGSNLFPGIFQIITHYIDAFFMKLFYFLVPGIGEVFAPEPGGVTTAGIERFMEFCANDYIFRIIFLFKLPYLIMEFITISLLFKVGSGKRDIFPGLKFLMFNPLIIYAVYIFGRFEIYAVFFMVLSLLFLRKDRTWLSGIFFGLAIITRAYPLFILPLIVILMPGNIRKKAIYTVFSSIPLAVVLTAFKIYNMVKERLGENIYVLSGVFSRESSFLVFILDSEIQLGEYKIQVFTTLYVLIIIMALYTRRRLIDASSANQDAGIGERRDILGSHNNISGGQYNMPDNNREVVLAGGDHISGGPDESWDRFMSASPYFIVIFFMVFYFSINYSAHWLSWFVPFGALLINKKSRYCLPFYILIACWFLYWVFNTDIGVFTPYLLSPMGEYYFHNIAQDIGIRMLTFSAGGYFDLEVLINIFRAFFSATIIWILAMICLDLRNDFKKDI